MIAELDADEIKQALICAIADVCVRLGVPATPVDPAIIALIAYEIQKHNCRRTHVNGSDGSHAHP